MAWVEENEVKGQEQYRMDRVGDYRKVDTEPKEPDAVDGREPEAHAPEFVRSTNASLEERFGAQAPDKAPGGKY